MEDLTGTEVAFMQMIETMYAVHLTGTKLWYLIMIIGRESKTKGLPAPRNGGVSWSKIGISVIQS